MTGRIEAIRDCGSIVQFFIRTGRGRNARTVVAAGDGNMTRRALEESGVGKGDRIEFDVTDWGGLEYFVPA